MTPQERELVANLFDRLSRLEEAPRDGDAERTIEDGLKRAPHAVYALVQTVLVQDEALKRANERIEELETQADRGTEPPRQGGFLDSMRDAILGPREPSRAGSVPSVPPTRQGSVWGNSGGYAPPPPPDAGYGPPGGYGPQAGYAPQQGGFGQGGSFLGTAASAAAGVVGGALLLNGIRSMFGHHHGASAYDPGYGAASPPWADSASHSSLAREAGLDDINRGGRDAGGYERVGLADTDDDDADDGDADDGDFEGDGGGSDYA
jgi:hypothetical protein